MYKAVGCRDDLDFWRRNRKLAGVKGTLRGPCGPKNTGLSGSFEEDKIGLDFSFQIYFK